MRQFIITQAASFLFITLTGLMVLAVTSCSSKNLYIQEIVIKGGDHIKVEIPLNKEVVDKIKPGITTKEEILNIFGPPTAMARKDKVMTLPPPGHLKAGFIEVDSVTFFEPFSLKSKNTDEHIVYYYYHPTIWGSESRLWLYINQAEGVVEDYIFRAPTIKKIEKVTIDEEEDY